MEGLTEYLIKIEDRGIVHKFYGVALNANRAKKNAKHIYRLQNGLNVEDYPLTVTARKSRRKNTSMII